MIMTLTPNPTLDLSGSVDQMIPNEKNYVSSEARYPGGNGINVARLLTRFGIPVIATGFLGKSVGSEVGSLLDHEDVKHNFVNIKGHTRISVTVSNEKTHQQTRLSFPGPKILSSEIQSLTRRIARIPKSSMLILGGSFPPGFKLSDANRLIKATQKRRIPVVVDIPGHLLRQINLDGVIFIKPNLIEFQDLVGSKVKSVSTIGRAAQKLAQKVSLVCVSSVNGGALLASRDFVWFGIPPKIKVRSTVGAGDSMVAGFAAELWRRKLSTEMCNDDSLLPELLRHGLSAAAATISAPVTELGSPMAARKFFEEIVIRKLRL